MNAEGEDEDDEDEDGLLMKLVGEGSSGGSVRDCGMLAILQLYLARWNRSQVTTR